MKGGVLVYTNERLARYRGRIEGAHEERERLMQYLVPSILFNIMFFVVLIMQVYAYLS